MPRKKNDAVQALEEEKKQLAEDITKKLPTVKAKQDTINEILQRLQEVRDNEPNLYGKGKPKHLSAVTSTHRAVDSQQTFIRTILDDVRRLADLEYRSQMGGDISRRDLMELIKIRGEMLPLWVSHDCPFPGEYVGAIAPQGSSKLNEGDAVAAFSKDGNWILADIITCHTNSRYECRDVDDDKKKLTVFSRNHLIPLPKWKANPQSDKHALFTKNAIVLALYPQTTCFYKGIVNSPPVDHRDPYQVAFEDESFPSGYCPPMPVSQKYVIAFKEVAGLTATTAPKKGNGQKKK
ncbi:hypothetical protein CAEBREN_01580 [Caenorhabditis brenneri]|uniref:SGF29 C-terminal domain-containing protein n=1 Tax=Caenorhabditis brenneri TaxID=135651 RepID=G0PK91_CAEBE|nr:hypothetical protein CAEBREN_18717 [Caenorhabditis brenneri]EGT43418.1 hypothetical protein CAEBREN_01580 [Caenorhabditis brenneri]